MIRCFFTVAGPVKLLPHFLDHYINLGVEEFVYCSYEREQKQYRQILEQVEDRCRADSVKLRFGFWEPERKMDWRHRAERIAQQVRQQHLAEDWALYPDLDEFVHVPGNDLKKYFATLSSKIKVVTGNIRDRVTEDGELVEIQRAVPLGRQFPFAANVTAHIAEDLKRQIEIIVACKGIVPTTHRPDAGTTNGVKKTPKPLNVDHYKWNADCLEHLKKRLAYYEAIDMPNKSQAKQTVAHIVKHGRIDVSNPKLKLRRINREEADG